MRAEESLAVHAYRAAVRLLLPDEFHHQFGGDMVAVFAELVAARRRRLAGLRAFAAELPGLIRLALRERRNERAQSSARRKERYMESLMQDLRFGGRSLRRAPGFVAIALSTLALGIGANTAIFSVVNSVLLTPLRLREPDRLMFVGEASRSNPNQFSQTSPASFLEWQSSLKTIRLGGFTGSSGTLTGTGEPQQLVGTTSIGGLLGVLGVDPLFGRLLTLEDEDPASPRVIVLSYEMWNRLYGNDRTVIGRTLTLNGTARIVVGVMPPGFTFPGSPNDFWVPSRYDAAFRANRDQYFIQSVGRLAAGATIEQARAETEAIAQRLRRDWPLFNTDLRILVMPLQEVFVRGARTQLYVLMGAVAFVLLITCANLGNLLLARAAARRREMAVRHALGAGRWRIARQLLTESTVLAAGGGALGLLVGRWFLKLLLAAQATTNLPRADEIALDGRALAFTLGISLLAGIIFGSIPAWQLSRAGAADSLRDGARGSVATWARSALVVSELALAMVLLIGAGLLLRSFDRLSRVDPGISNTNALTFRVSLAEGNVGFFQTTLDRIRALPGVRAAALVSQLPITGRGGGAWFNRIDRPLPAGVQPTGEVYRVITPEYFSTVGIPLRAGRFLSTQDRRESPAVVVNDALAKKYYPNENPLGKEIYLGAPDNRVIQHAPIVGVVGDTRDAGLGTDPLPTVYIPLAMKPEWPQLTYIIRTDGDPTTVATPARQIIRALDPALPIRNVRTLEDVLGSAVAPARWSTTLLGVFAGVAFVMAVLGVFGVLSFIVTQRTRELGIRIALGASSAAVRRMVVWRGLLMAGAGVALGVAGAALLTRFMSTLLFGITPTDPVTYAGVAVSLIGAAALASYLPARRATRVDPIVALRTE